MAGAWEIRDNPSILGAILHVDVTTLAWSFGFRNLLPANMPFLPLAGMPFDHARNAACMKALDMGAEYLFFLDSDVVPPRDAVVRLLKHRKPIVSGMYRRRSPPVSVPVMIKNGIWVTDFPPNQLLEVDVCGAGCLLIRRDVLEKLPPQRPQAGKHWFDWRVDCGGAVPGGANLSEDFTFNVHAKQYGFPTFVDTSVRCRHIGYGESDGDGNWKPLEVISA